MLMSVIKVHTNVTRMLIVPTGKDRTIVRVEMGTTEMASSVQVTENLLCLLNLDSIHLCSDITTSYNITLPILTLLTLLTYTYITYITYITYLYLHYLHYLYLHYQIYIMYALSVCCPFWNHKLFRR